MSRNIFSPSDEQKLNALCHVRYEIDNFLNITEKWSKKDLEKDEELRETVLIRRVVHFRSLYDFFSASLSDRHNDDVLAIDYNYRFSEINKGPQDRQRFNKEIFHLTYSRKHDAVNKRWDISQFDEMAKECRAFVRYVVNGNTNLKLDEEELVEWENIEKK